MNDGKLSRCQQAIGHTFSQPKLLEKALTHASAAATRAASNERLEFLGDAVLAMVICEEIFRRGPDLAEGDMTKIKSRVVSRQTCAEVSEALGLDAMLALGKGISSQRALPMSVAAAVFESVLGAIFLDGGFEPARKFVLAQLGGAIEAAMNSAHQRNYKSLLQQHAQRKWNRTPAYDVLDEKGPEHAKCFEVAIRLDGRTFPSAWGSSKKEAEQKAALNALQELDLLAAAEETPDAEDQ